MSHQIGQDVSIIIVVNGQARPELKAMVSFETNQNGEIIRTNHLDDTAEVLRHVFNSHDLTLVVNHRSPDYHRLFDEAEKAQRAKLDGFATVDFVFIMKFPDGKVRKDTYKDLQIGAINSSYGRKDFVESTIELACREKITKIK